MVGVKEGVALGYPASNDTVGVAAKIKTAAAGIGTAVVGRAVGIAVVATAVGMAVVGTAVGAAVLLIFVFDTVIRNNLESCSCP
jgi:hypothetical protein